MYRIILLTLVVGLLACTSKTPKEDIDVYLSSGRLQDARKVYQTWGNDPQTQFESGLVTVLDGLADFLYTLTSYVKKDVTAGAPVDWASVIERKPITYKLFIKLFSDLRDKLLVAADHLEKGGNGDWKSAFRPIEIKVDLNKNGVVEPSENLEQLVFFGVSQALNDVGTRKPSEMVIAADAADSLWLSGYCHLSAGVLGLALAYNWAPLFNAYGLMVFEIAKPEPSGNPEAMWNVTVADPKQGVAARKEFLEVLRINAKTIAALNAEGDDDREWIPSPKQHSVTGVVIDEERWKGWKAFSRQLEEVLEGRLLVDVENSKAQGKGLNVKKLLEELPTLSMFVTEEAKSKYLESAAPEKILGEDQDIFRFINGNDGLFYAFFIN